LQNKTKQAASVCYLKASRCGFSFVIQLKRHQSNAILILFTHHFHLLLTSFSSPSFIVFASFLHHFHLLLTSFSAAQNDEWTS